MTFCFWHVVFGEAEMHQLMENSFTYCEEEVRKLITVLLSQQRTFTKTLQTAAYTNLPQIAAQDAVGLHKIMRESKQRKIMPWLQLTKEQAASKRDKDSNQSKMKVLDVKIVQQVFKRINRAEVLESTIVLDGTGKNQLDQDSDEVIAILNGE